jgi:organic radical activating enzyme
MIPNELESNLSQKYQVVCFVDLADINQTHTTIYKILQQYRKEAFEPNERIVFYSNYCPSDLLLQHIQKAINLIDISSCFVMICGPHDISSKLDALKQDTSMEYYYAKVDSKALRSDQLLNEHTLCPIAWSNLAIMTQGVAKACCVYDEAIGSIIDQTLDSLFYSQPMQELRDSMLTGQRHKSCDHCWKLEDQHIMSNRQWHLKFYAKQFYTSWIDDPKIRTIDFRPSNVCNFKCRICGSGSSSQIANEQLQFTVDPKEITKLKTLNKKGQWFDSDDASFVDQLLELLPSLVNIDFYGGEPFLLKQLPKILKHAIDLDCAKNIRLHFNTNGSIFPTQLIEHLKHFKEIDICFSIDNVNERFALERGGSWQEVEHNIALFKNLTKGNFVISIGPTVNIQNVLYLEDIINWTKENNYRIVWNYLDNPEFFSIDNMTDAAKKLVVDNYQNTTHPELKNICEHVKNSAGSNGKEFVKFMQMLDQRRKQSFLKSHNEIAIAMGYSV